MPMPRADPELAHAVRDCLAGQFSLAIGAEHRAVMEVLEHRMGQSANRDRWQPLHDALETLRALKPQLREKLDAAVRKRIDAKISPEPDAFSKTARFSAASLTLVSEDDVQEEIAVGNTTRRLREATGDQLFALNARLAIVMGMERIDDDRSPAHPRVFARALLDVISELAPDTVSRLAAFTAHDPALLQALGTAYRDANALLVARGILPDFRSSYGAPEQVAGVRAVTHDTRAQVEGKPEAPPSPPRPAPVTAPLPTAFDRLLATAAAPEVVVNDLVAAVFARLVGDPRLIGAAQTALGRLQPAVRKAVLADRRFFTDPGHPIRGLIDAMAELGSKGASHHHVEGKLPGDWLADETQALLAANRFDAATIGAARDRLARLAQRHHEILVEDDAVVRSVRRQEEERAAVQDSALEIAHRISSADVAESAAAFVYAMWRPVLVQAHRAAGHGSAQWNAELATLDDLLWTLAPRVTAAERERFEALVPSVRDRVRQGLVHARLPEAEIESRLAEVDRLHAELRRSPAAAVGALTSTAGLGQGIADDVTATLHVTSEDVADEGLARGAWFEFTDDDGMHLRARLNWLSAVQGACVFKEPARNRSFAISLADLRAKRDAGRARPVDGPGVAHACIEGAIADLARERGLDPGLAHGD